MIAFYARGSGQGHMMRALAMARLLKDLDPIVIHDSQWRLPCKTEQVREVPGHSALSFLFANEPGVLVVDVVQRGLGGELVTFIARSRAFKVYVYRHMTQIPTVAELAVFDRVLAAEPGVDGIDVCPILIRNPEDLPRENGPVVERPVVPNEYPFMASIALASGVRSAAGYNTYWEAKALGVPGQWTATEQTSDDQQWRLDTFVDLQGPVRNKAADAANVVRELVTNGK